MAGGHMLPGCSNDCGPGMQGAPPVAGGAMSVLWTPADACDGSHPPAPGTGSGTTLLLCHGARGSGGGANSAASAGQAGGRAVGHTSGAPPPGPLTGSNSSSSDNTWATRRVRCGFRRLSAWSPPVQSGSCAPRRRPEATRLPAAPCAHTDAGNRERLTQQRAGCQSGASRRRHTGAAHPWACGGSGTPRNTWAAAMSNACDSLNARRWPTGA